MSFSYSAGGANNFAVGYSFLYPPDTYDLKLIASSATYSAPAPDAVNFPNLPAEYTRKLGSAANFIDLGSASNIADGVAAVPLTVAGDATYVAPVSYSEGFATVALLGDGSVNHGVVGQGAFSVPIGDVSSAVHGVSGTESCSVPLVVSGVGIVQRYELRGEVRDQGMLVDRQVRAYRRDDGTLVGEVSTSAGKFRIPTGLVAREHYVVAIDTSTGATDWIPPVANRLISVLAQDAA